MAIGNSGTRGTGRAMYISAEELRSRLGEENLVIVDCFYNWHEYRRGHIPTAIKRLGHPYVKCGSDEEPGLYYPENFPEKVEEMGISSDTLVIAYDSDGSLFAARFLWALLLHGHENVKLLDGGWQGWIAKGYPVSVEIFEPLHRGRFSSSYNPELVVTKDQIKLGEMILLDVRSLEEYTGQDNRGNKRGGRIPTSVHMEWREFLTSRNTSEEVAHIRPLIEIQERLSKISSDKPIVTYCQGGVRAALVAYILHSIGYNSSVYDGSMKEWANDDSLPME